MAMPTISEAYIGQAAALATEHWSGPPEMTDRLAALLRPGPGDLVLDVGCGVGGPAARLVSLTGCTVLGIDPLEPLVVEAARRPGLLLAVGAGESLPVADGSVDQVWALGVVAHLRDLGAFARGVARVLRPGGSVAITEAFRGAGPQPRFAASAPRPWRALSAGGVAEELRAAGLEAVRGLPWPGDGLPGALDAADPDLRRDLRDARLVPALLVARRPGG
jgi:SAM-dependent methyltransferase